MQEDQKIPEGNVHPDNSVLSKDSEFYLPQDVLDKYTDDLLYVTDVDAKVKMAVGVRLHDNDWIAKSGWFANVKEPVIGICSSAQNQDTAKAFLLYVLGEE